MRVQSSKPMKNGGWLHKSGNAPVPYIPPIRPAATVVTLDAEAYWGDLKSKSPDVEIFLKFCESLGVEPTAMDQVGCLWDEYQKAWAFPMKNGKGEIVGIRLRSPAGDKWAVKGSRQGIFAPYGNVVRNSGLWIVEGPSDLASALSLGFLAIGRPSCMGCEEIVLDYLDRNKVKEVVLCADNDDPGINGAEKLQASLKVPSVLWLPPCKDLREFVKLGGTRAMIESYIKDLLWTKPKIS